MMLNETFISETSEFIAESLIEINTLTSTAESAEDVAILRRRIHLFVEEMEVKKDQINHHIQEIRIEQRELTEGLSRKRTPRDPGQGRDRSRVPWQKMLVILEKQIVQMKDILNTIDQQTV